ncbi:protein NLP2-like isoform X2 [Wolffia australiana]
MSLVPRYLGSPLTLADRMLRALSLFKESSSGKILAQVWMPVQQSDGFVLSTSDQPYLLDQILSGYREISRAFTFSAKEGPDSFPGLPGRVFLSRNPEWTPNVSYYSKNEYLRVNFALAHEVRGSLALPVFDSTADGSCCAVLELVTTKEKANFDHEREIICSALQAVNLKTVRRREHKQNISRIQRSVFAEIVDVLRTVCHAHALPMALTWTPCSYVDTDTWRGDPRLSEPTTLRVQESACYVNDMRMVDFIHACSEGYLRRGQGVAGRAFESNFPFFSSDIKEYNMQEYPFVHHARRFGLTAAVAIRLRSTHSGNDDYVLEFLLPVNCKDSVDQQLLLDSLSATMQRVCRSLRTVSNAEVMVGGSACVDFRGGWTDEKDKDSRLDQMIGSQLAFPFERKRSTAEKNISLSTLQQYFSGSLKDAAKNIGVCPTTLKRICRQHGISRWPSRKINKVNRSLKKIQTVIDSVQGVDGSLKYDPRTGSFVAALHDPPEAADVASDPTAHHSSSAMTDSSNGSQSSSQTAKRSPDGAVTVKATYREDTVRFKFAASGGQGRLMEEVGRRFQLSQGGFQLKYLDDEDEWVLLSTEEDLREAVEIMELAGGSSLKLLVRDAPFSVGSSGASNFLS